MIEIRKIFEQTNRLDRKVGKLNRELQHIKTAIEHVTQEIQEIQILINESGVTLTDEYDKKLTLESSKNNIGRSVEILNPKRNEPNIGTIDKVGKLYVTIKLPNGVYKKRIPKNLKLINHDRSER